MICPLEIASDLSALRAARVADHGKHGWLLEGRDGVGDESAGSDFTGDGETDHLREGYQEFGYDGLFDKRRGKASPRRVPMALAEQVLQIYREKYFDLNVLHFHQKLVEEHGIRLSYTWVKLALPGAGLVARERKRGVHRKRRQRRPLPGMLLHIDGSRHRWFQDERWYDLLVILDDATSEIYYAQLVEEESTLTVMAGLKAVIARQGVFCALYSDRGSHFWLTPKVGGKVDPHRLTPSGACSAGVGNPDDSGVLATGARTERAQFPHLAGTASARTATTRGRDGGSREPVPARALRGRVQSQVSGQSPATGQCFSKPREARSGSDLLVAVRAYGQSGQHGAVPEPELAD